MADKKIVATRNGDSHRYDVVEDPGNLINPRAWYIRRDGEPYKGSYRTLKDAVDAAEDESGDRRP